MASQKLQTNGDVKLHCNLLVDWNIKLRTLLGWRDKLEDDAHF
jgi:hypothetical protein